ncbi:hypothetical protein H4R24_000686 [Coemansia sp. RSA 988]|nr:hypothetical protein H4R24_000686 [Coemansia sp. RSA 988]
MAQLQGATVKLALSGDSVVLRGAQRGNQPPPERTLGLAFIQAPRLGNATRGTADEPLALEAREYLRRRIAGKPVKFVVRHRAQSGREYGSLYVGDDTTDIAIKLVHEGWARVTDSARTRASRADADAGEADVVAELVNEEEFARRGKRGLWEPKPKASRPRLTTFEGDAAAFQKQHGGRELRATVEQVRDAAALRVLLHLPDAHQMVTLRLAGVRAPAESEPFGAEAKYNVELRLLQRDVRVQLQAVAPGPTNGIFVGTVSHDAGSIAEWLVANAFARVADGAVSLLGDSATHLRQLERTAQGKRMRIWRDFSESSAPTSFDATVVRIISGDTLVVHEAQGVDRELRLASVRVPRASDETQGGYSAQAREALRRLCIGRTVTAAIEYRLDDSRDYASVRCGNTDLGVHVVERGLASVVRARPGGTRATAYDELLAAESRARDAHLGIHSGRPLPPPALVDASENATRARAFVANWQRVGRVPCVVDHISGGARMRLLVDRDNARMTLVLAGIRCPRAPRGDDASSAEPLGAEALALTTHHVLQRNAEVEIESVDKNGGFIGSLFVGGRQNWAETLLEHGLATVHSSSADRSPHRTRLYAAEDAAKKARRGYWAAHDPSAVEEAPREAAASAVTLQPRIEFLDVAVSELVSPMSFFVQIATPASIAELESMMAALAAAPPPAPVTKFAPAPGQLVCACYTAGDQWHRARIVQVLPDKYEVLYIDFGNSEALSAARVRPMPTQFAAKAPFALAAQLAFLRLPVDAPDSGFVEGYVDAAYAALRPLLEGRQLVANVEARPPNGPLQLTLYDPELGRPVLDKSVNAVVAAAGYAIVDSRALSSRHNRAAATTISAIVEDARTAHRGMWEYGDVTTDE